MMKKQSTTSSLLTASVKIAVLMGCLSFISGCSYLGWGEYFRDRSDDYRRSQEIPPIRIPDDLDYDLVGELYPVPSGGEVVSYQIDDQFVIPRPRSVAVNESVNEIKVQRLGQDAWILMSVPPGEAWPKIRSYLTRSGIPTAKADASKGVIETALFKLNDNPDLFQQFKISVSRGVQFNTTEINILQRSFSSDDVPEVLPQWLQISADFEREEWMRTSLSQALAVENSLGAASLLGQEIGAASKVELFAAEGHFPYIEMRVAMARAWASVGYALSKDGFSVAENNFNGKYYLVEFKQPEGKKPAFWRRMFFAREEAKVVESYRIDIRETQQGIEVRVSYADGREMTQRQNYLILRSIRNNLA